MWPFPSYVTLEKSGVFENFTDWHSHILPGVDDGVKTLEESLEILSLYERLGVTSVWFTPHVMADIPNETEALRERFHELQQAYEGSILLHLAAEYMLDDLFVERLENDDLLPLGNEGRMLLVETSYHNPPMNFWDILEKIKSHGYFPVLAHPERYRYLQESDCERLKKSGVKFQLNLPALTGAYSPATRQRAKALLTKGFYDFLGTDTHRLSPFLNTIEKCKISKSCLKQIVNTLK